MADIKSHSTLPTSLVAYWDLEEASGTRYDLVGSKHLTENGTGGVGQGTGKIGNGADFVPADSDYLSNLNIGTTVSSTLYSMSAWVYPHNLTGRFTVFMLRRTTSAEADGAEVEVGNGSGTSNTVALDVNAWWATGGANAITLNAWNHIVVTVGGTGTGDRKIYVNGVDVTTGSTGTFAQTGSCDEVIIGSRNGTSQFFDGVIDEVGLWSKVLTASEVTDLYNSGSGLPYYEPADIKNDSTLSTSLEGFWLLDEASGTRADSTANGRDLSESGGTPGQVTGILDSAADFDGVNEYLRTASNWTHYAAQAISFNVWIKTSTDNGTDMVMNINNGSVETFQIIKIAGSNGYRADVRAGGTAYVTSVVPEADIEDGAWHMLTAVYDGADLHLYLDGVLRQTNASASGNINTSGAAKLALGARSTGADLFLDASLDHTGAWSKALSVSEIRALYGYGTPPVYEAAAAPSTFTPRVIFF